MSRRGFTLIEMLLATALIATLSLAIFTCLSNGIKLWDRSRTTVLAEDITIFFDRFSADVRNAFLFSTLPVEGREHVFAFPAIVFMTTDRIGARASEEMADQFGRVRYSFDPATGEVIRQQANYSQGVRKVWEESSRVLVKGVKEMVFRYQYQGAKDYQSHADDGVLPSGVEVVVRFMDGHEEREISRFVPVPLGL